MTTQSIRVLIVDDEESFRTPLVQHFQDNYKYTVDSAASVDEALHFLEKSSYDVALIDQVLDKDTNSGQKLLKTITTKHPDIQVIMFTGWGMENGIEALRQGAYRYFAKPFNLEELALTIKFAAEESRVRRERQYLQSLYNASSEIISPREPQEVLRNIVIQARESTNAWRVVIVLVDEGGRPRLLASSSLDDQLDTATSIRSSGISYEVINSGIPRFIGDVEIDAKSLNPAMLKQGVKSAACLPLPLMGRNIGVLWVQFQEAHIFSEAETQALQIFANQSAIAYENARRIQELERLRKATDAMAGVAEPKEVLKTIVEGARLVMDADFALIWSYDAIRDMFIPEELVADGIPEEWLEVSRKEEPKAGTTTRLVLENGYVSVTNISTDQAKFLGESSRSLLNRLGVKSFQSIRLDVAGEPLGILHVDYKTERDFGTEERRTLENFANHAALTLKKVRLLKQVGHTREVARTVAEVTTLGKLEGTLKEIVRGAKDVLGCDIVTLYTFDEKTQRFIHVAGVGIHMTNNLLPPYEVPHNSSLWRVIELGEPGYHLAENAPGDILLQGGFVHREKVQSALAVQLRFGDERVGVMFVSYRTLHRFTQGVINDALQFGNQAAVAIRNAQLHGETEKRADALVGLYKAGKAITSTLAVDEVLARIAEQALNIVGAKPEEGCFSHVALFEGTKLKFIAASPTEMLNELNRNEINLKTSPKKGIDGRAALTGVSQYAPDIKSNPDYIPTKENINSQLSVPLKIGERIIGVLSIEHPQLAAFGDEDVKNVELLAAQATVAIQNAQQYEELRQTKGLVGSRTALAWMGMASSTWRHAVENNAITIRDQVELLRRELKDSTEVKVIGKRLSSIDRLAEQIIERPIAPPLSSEEGVQSLVVNEFLQERTQQLRTGEKYKEIELKLELTAQNSTTVRASSAWLQRALDILIDNAVQAVAGQRQALIAVGSKELDQKVEIFVSDNGHGIPSDLLPQLFNAPVEKSTGSSGSGLGLLLARTIVETFRGEIHIQTTGLKGTTIAIILPKEQIEDPKTELSKLRSIEYEHVDKDLKGTNEDLKATSPFEYERLYNERNRAYEELKELDRKKTEFLSTVSHELRSPLTSVQSCIENLLSGMYGFLNEKQHSRLEIALVGAREESRLIANLLDLARLEEGKTTLDLAPIDICKIIHNVVVVFQSDAIQKEINLAEDFPVEELPEIIVDRGKIIGVVTNLISNALKFTSEGGVITISAHKRDDQVEIQVKDTGIGIPEGEFSKIFDRFYQVDNTLTRKVGGTGIGLNIAKEYIEMHEGRIWVESKVDEGSTFIFTIPTHITALE